MDQIGFVGLGKMGLPMALNLLKAGFSLSVVSRSRPPVERALEMGGKEAPSPRALAIQTKTILTCLPDIEALEAVYLGADGLFEGARPNQLFIDHSTISPKLARTLFEKARQKGADFLDAPVSGGPEGAKAGSLSIMVGGEPSAFEKARAILDALGKHIVHFGPPGAGSMAKLINNMFVGILNFAVAEAFFLAARAGLDAETLYATLTRSTAKSAMLERNFPLLQKEDFAPRFSMAHLLKDLRLLQEAASDIGFVPESLQPPLRAVTQAVEGGMGEIDISAVALLFQKPNPR